MIACFAMPCYGGLSGDAVAEAFLFRVDAHGFKRQYRDRRSLVGRIDEIFQ